MQEEIKDEVVEEEVVETEEETTEDTTEETEELEQDSSKEPDTEDTSNNEESGEEGIEIKDTTMYTTEQMEAIAKRREKRIAEKKDKEYQKKLADLERLASVIKSGTKIDDTEKLIESLTQEFKKQNIDVKVPSQPSEVYRYSDEEETYLAEKDFAETKALGEDEMDSEAKRLYQIGYANLSRREQVYYGKLCQELVDSKDLKELKKKGVKQEVVDNPQFKELRSQFKGSASDFYEKIYKPLYLKEEKPESAGSQSGTSVATDKNYYSESEVEKLVTKMTPEQLSKNPKLLNKIKESLSKW